MYDPRFRLALLISIIVALVTSAQIVYSYLLDDKGLNFQDYVAGATSVGTAIIGGLVFVWICLQFITFTKYRKTGLELTHIREGGNDSYVDETGTKFNFPVKLSKFIPEIAAPPHRELHPLELELIGFLNGYRNWPYDVTGDNKKSLYQHSMEQWQAMQSLPNIGFIHSAAALAQDLSKIYAYKESRKVYPYWQFWKRDEVSYSRKCYAHGGISAFILSTMPSFRELGNSKNENQRYRRALLTAITYRDNPVSIPANCDPLAKEIFEALHKAQQKSLLKPGEEENFTPDEAAIKLFNNEIFSYFQEVIRDMEVNPADINEKSDGVYLGNGNLVVSLKTLVTKYAKVMSPSTRGNFNLWELDGQVHPSWNYFIKGLKEIKVLVETWEDITPENGIFNLRVSNMPFPDAILLKIDPVTYPEMFNGLNSLPKWNGIMQVEQNQATLLQEVQRKAADVSRMLQNVYGQYKTH